MPIFEHIISLLTPHDCMGCKAEGTPICSVCLEGMFLPSPSRCYRCQKITQDHATCPSCRKKTVLKHVWVVTDYDDTAKQLVHSLKFGHVRSAAVPIAELMSRTLPFMDKRTLVTFVPTATIRRRQRGFDQSEIIAKHLARKHNLTYAPLLSRLGRARQVGAKRSQRIEQVSNAYRVRNQYVVKDRSVLLVDDITTTGATLEEAAKVLRKAGAKSVDAVVFAQRL